MDVATNGRRALYAWLFREDCEKDIRAVDAGLLDAYGE